MYWQGDVVAAAVIAVLVSMAYSGFRIGFAQAVAGFAAIAAAVFFAPMLASRYEATFADYAQTSGLVNRYACMVTIGLLISLVAGWMLNALVNRFLAKRTHLKRLNAYAGIVFGVVEGSIFLLFILGGALSGQLWLRDLNLDDQPNRWAAMIDATAAATRQSILGDTIRDLNPFERIGVLAQVGDLPAATKQLSDPEEFSALLDDRRIRELTEDPEFSTALKELQEDPVIRKVIDEGQPIDARVVIRLLNSPTMIKLVDQPRFVQTARDVLLDR